MVERERRVGRLGEQGPHSSKEHRDHAAGNIIFGRLRRDVVSIAEKGLGFDWDIFSLTAREVWRDYVPGPDSLEATRPNPEELARLRWSPLVPEKMRGERLVKHIERAWDIWEAFRADRIDLNPYVAVAGTMGAGKSVFSRALRGARPAECRLYPEMWEDNPDLMLFYQLLASYTSPEAQQSSHFEELRELLLRVQGSVQGYFGGLKFLQKLMAMKDLKDYAGIQDVDLGQDGVYFKTQVQLSLASQENIQSYEGDNRLRQRLLPPYLRAPILVHLWVPFKMARERVLKARGRKFEKQVPEGYLKALHLNTIQWMLAMKQAGVPVVLVDAERSDFRPGRPDRPAVVDLVWEEIERGHRDLWRHK